jgi:hypothetical protein
VTELTSQLDSSNDIIKYLENDQEAALQAIVQLQQQLSAERKKSKELEGKSSQVVESKCQEVQTDDLWPDDNIKEMRSQLEEITAKYNKEILATTEIRQQKEASNHVLDLLRSGIRESLQKCGVEEANAEEDSKELLGLLQKRIWETIIE